MFRLPILLLFVIMFSCDKHVQSSDFYKDFEDNRWAFNHEIEFDFTISQGDELWLHFGHIYDYDYDMLPIELEITRKEGDFSKIISQEKLKIKNRSGGDAGDCLGDICDVYQKVDISDLQQGNYHMIMRNKSDLPYLPNVLGVGYQIRKPNK